MYIKKRNLCIVKILYKNYTFKHSKIISKIKQKHSNIKTKKARENEITMCTHVKKKKSPIIMNKINSNINKL